MNARVIIRLGRLCCCWALAAAGPVWGQITTNIAFTNLNLSIPDNDNSGITDSHTLTGIPGVISSVQVSLDLQGTGDGAFNGDYYAELVNDTGGYAVLLNRSGVSSANSFGYGDNGFDVTFSDSASDDIHFYQNDTNTLNALGQLTGLWLPDGEDISPLSPPSAFDNALNQATATLDSFDLQNPNQTWTLYLADVSGGGTGEVVNWSLTIKTTPEPGPTGLLLLGLLAAGWSWRRQRPRRPRVRAS